MLFDFDNETDMNAKEKELVTTQLIESGQTYNLCEGGQGGFGHINRAGLSGSKAGVKKRLEMISQNPLWWDSVLAGRQMPVDMGQRSLAGKLRNGFNFATFKGKKHTEETKRKISLAAKLRRQAK